MTSETHATSAEPLAMQPPAERRLRRSRWIVGLVGVVLGVLVALVCALPAIVNAHGSERAEAWFAENYHGQLEVGPLALAWFDEQTVDGLVLTDPEGYVVARGRAVLPPLIDGLSSGFDQLGVVRLELEAQVTRDPSGQTNLERALEARGTDVDWGDTVRGDLEVQFDLQVSRLQLLDRESDLSFELVDLAGSVQIDPQDPIAIRLEGREGRGGSFQLGADVFAEPHVAFQPLRTEFSFDAQGLVLSDLFGAAFDALGSEPVSLEVRGLLASGERDVRTTVRGNGLDLGLDTSIHAVPFELPGLAPSTAGSRGSWDVEFAGAGALPAQWIDRALDLDGLITGALGSALAVDFGGRLRSAEGVAVDVPFELSVGAELATVEWAGAYRAGRLVSAVDEGLTAALTWNSVVEERIVRPFVPIASLVTRREPDPAIDRATGDTPSGSEPVRLTLRNVDAGWPFAIDDARAEIGLGLGPASIDLLPVVADRMAFTELGLDEEVVRLGLDDGRVRYPELALSLNGSRIPVTGSYDLLTRTLAFDGSIPAALVGQKLTQQLGPLGGVVGDSLALDFTIAGDPDDPVVRFHSPKLDLDGAGDLLQGLPGFLETSLPKKRD